MSSPIYLCFPLYLFFIYIDVPEVASSSSQKRKRKNVQKIDAMYGAMNPLFIENCVIQPSRLGISSDFLDIGSGIGQVVIQVAATVGCKATG